MKILIIRETNPFCASNATNNRFLALVEGLVNYGCEIKILITSGFYGKAEKKKYDKVGIINSIEYEYLLPVNFSVFLIRQLLYRYMPIIYYDYRVRKILKKRNTDIVWVDYAPKALLIGLSVANYKEQYGFKVFHERSEFSWIGLNWIGLYSKKRVHYKYLYELLPKVDVLALMTTRLMSYYKNYTSQKAELIHLPMTVDFKRFEGLKEVSLLKKPYIAYCGTMNNEKDGVDILIKSFMNIMNKYKDMHLYIAGPLLPSSDYLSQLSIIKKSNAENRITYLGNLEREEIPSFLFNAKVLALARPESLQAEGGFPTKLGEYLATGNPVCVTNTGEITTYLKHRESAYIASPGSEIFFSQVLSEALDSNNAKVIGEMGQGVAKKYFNKDIQSRNLFFFLKKSIISK
jgi:glycosyltransferase involved in cell wall biosynthesis